MNATELPSALLHTDTDELARLHARLAAQAQAEGLLDIAYRTVDSPVGSLLLAASDAGLMKVAFEVQDHDAVLAALAAKVSPRILRAPGRLDPVARQLDEYFAGTRRSFDLALDWRLSAGFRRQVLDHLIRIGYGSHRELRRGRGRRGHPAGGPRGRHRVRDQPARRSWCRATAWSARTARRAGTPGECEAKATLLALEAAA